MIELIVDRTFMETRPQARALTVGQLRKRLAAVDETFLVLLPGPEGGFSGLDTMEVHGVVLNANNDPSFGPHEVPADGQRPNAVALVLLSAVSR